MEAFLTELVGKYGYRSIYFDDDTFNLGDKHVENYRRWLAARQGVSAGA